MLAFATIVAIAGLAFAGDLSARFGLRLPDAMTSYRSSSIGAAEAERGEPAAPVPPPPLEGVIDEHIDTLRQQGLLPSDQGVYVASLGDQAPLLAHNADRLYNVASCMKLVTTALALELLPADHRFATEFVAGGLVVDGVLEGDLGVRSDGDPTLGAKTLGEIARALREQGIRRVSGDLVVAGPFSYRSYDETPVAIDRFASALERAGIEISGGARGADRVDGTALVRVESDRLGEIVQRVNAHSINWIADNLATTVGGPQAMRAYLRDRLGIAPTLMVVTNGSGLDDNRLTARGMVAVVEAVVDIARRRGLEEHQVLPLAGVDSSTMRVRFQDGEYRGSVIAKTGTQSNVDGGVATLAGIAHTRERGPVVFAILNSHGDVHSYRKWEDAVVRSIVEASGGPSSLGRADDIVPPSPSHTIRHLGRAVVTTEEAGE
jgi:D-alanyl-D-alanine carboxypeptidase/D-alanyl-D-alanine-endopeptidase (penicillin-binding protein 4)